MSLQARKELIKSVRTRYKAANNNEKHKILSEVVENTGYHIKYAITLLNSKKEIIINSKQKHPRIAKYNDEIKKVFVSIWKNANEICAKRIIPFLPTFVETLERSGNLNISEETHKLLLSMSPATADRLLKSERGNPNRGKSTTRAGKLLKNQIQIRTFSDWNDVNPGFFEGDLVAHCGNTVRGTYLNTLTLTDIYSGWTECQPLLKKSEAEVIYALQTASKLLPFPMLGFDSDNGSEFINYALLNYCEEKKITFTRSRPYKKNDQAHVEEKNGSIVRRMIGYDRYEGENAYQILLELYLEMRLYINFFQPSMKLLSKERRGAKVLKKYDVAKTPHQRLMQSSLDEKIKDNLSKQFQSLDPVKLLKKINLLQEQFWQYGWKDTSIQPNGCFNEQHNMAASNLTKIQSSNLKPQENLGEEPMAPVKRKYHITKKPRKIQAQRAWRTRKDPFEHVWMDIQAKLKINLHYTAKYLFQELQKAHPNTFADSQLRTMQRRIAKWRKNKLEENRSKLLELSQTTLDTACA